MNEPKRISYADKRQARWELGAHAWGTLAAEDLFADWDEPDSIPASKVESISLLPALTCAYVGDFKHAEAFCRWADAVAERILAEDRCRANEICEAGYPRNAATVLRGQAYARWLLGQELDRGQMLQAAEHFVTWCLTKVSDRKRFVDSITMNFYLAGVRAAMVACDLDYAAELLKTRQRFRWHHEKERALWTRLVEAYPDVGEELAAEVEVFFDRVRDPDFTENPDGKAPTFINRDILALETGILRQMYVINPFALDPLDARTVLRAVAY